jgi:sulfite exporter TauE/SafE
LGTGLWRRIQPHTRRFLPADTPKKALMLGMLWGWLPCGLVYTVLFTALLSGSALKGAILLLAFGLGTLPNLMAAAALVRKSRSLFTGKTARLVSGAAVMAFGVYGIAHAVSLGAQIRSGLLCFS